MDYDELAVKDFLNEAKKNNLTEELSRDLVKLLSKDQEELNKVVFKIILNRLNEKFNDIGSEKGKQIYYDNIFKNSVLSLVLNLIEKYEIEPSSLMEGLSQLKNMKQEENK